MSFKQKLWTGAVLKNKKFYILLAVEVILCVVCIISMCGKKAAIDIDATQMTQMSGEYREDLGGYYNDAYSEDAADFVEASDISLAKGTYRILIDYGTDVSGGSVCSVSAEDVSYGALLSDTVAFYAGESQTDFGIWLKEDTDNFKISVPYGGSGYLLVSGMHIVETNASHRMALFVVICLSILIDLLYAFCRYDREYSVRKERKNVIAGLLVITVFTSVPVFTNYLVEGADLIFHLQRIEGIKDALLSGQFPVRMQPNWLYGHGYPVSIYYGDTLLYIPAFLRIIGFPVQTCYQIFEIFINGATALTAYLCIKGIFKNRYAGLLGSMLYTCSLYRLYSMYGRMGVGEYIAMLFLPVLCYGFYRIYTEDIQSAQYAGLWMIPVIGFSGVIQSHLLTCEITGLFVIILCVILWKYTFRKQTFYNLVKIVIGTILLNAWFLVPFLQSMLTEDIVIKNVTTQTIQNRGLYLAHLLFVMFGHGASSVFYENGMVNTDPIGIGFALLIGLMAFLYMVYMRKQDAAGNLKNTGVIAAVLGILAMVMSLHSFPWDKIQSLGGVTKSLVSSLQFPWRFLSVSTACLTIVACTAVIMIKQSDLSKYTGKIVMILLIFTVIVAGYMMNDVMVERGFYHYYDESGLGSGNVVGGEYLPTSTDVSLLSYHTVVPDEHVEIQRYDKDNLTVECACANATNEAGYIEVPMLYYNGYLAENVTDGTKLTAEAGNNGVVRVEIPAGFTGTIRIQYKSSMLWRIAEIVSFITAIFMGFRYYKFRNRRGDQYENNSNHYSEG